MYLADALNKTRLTHQETSRVLILDIEQKSKYVSRSRVKKPIHINDNEMPDLIDSTGEEENIPNSANKTRDVDVAYTSEKLNRRTPSGNESTNMLTKVRTLTGKKIEIDIDPTDRI